MLAVGSLLSAMLVDETGVKKIRRGITGTITAMRETKNLI